MKISFDQTVLTHPQQIGVSEIHEVQHEADDGEERTNDVHGHGKARLRGEKELL